MAVHTVADIAVLQVVETVVVDIVVKPVVVETVVHSCPQNQ